MNGYDIIAEAFIDNAPDVVWKALVDELNGGRQWWVPHNTFEPGAVPPEQVGGQTEVTVHTKGVDKGGMKLRFTQRTRAVVPGRRLTADYVDGVFRGVTEFTVDPIEGGRRSRIAMLFKAEPQGKLKLIARLADVGQQHQRATQQAFANLQAIIGTGVGSQR